MYHDQLHFKTLLQIFLGEKLLQFLALLFSLLKTLDDGRG